MQGNEETPPSPKTYITATYVTFLRYFIFFRHILLVFNYLKYPQSTV